MSLSKETFKNKEVKNDEKYFLVFLRSLNVSDVPNEGQKFCRFNAIGNPVTFIFQSLLRNSLVLEFEPYNYAG
jgi:hypothetical protein